MRETLDPVSHKAPDPLGDDFPVLVSGTYEDACREAEAIVVYLEETAKHISRKRNAHYPTNRGVRVYAHRISMTWHDPYGHTPHRTPKRKVLSVRYRIPQWTTGSPTMPSLATILRNMNPIVRGWSYFFRCGVANRIPSNLYRCVEDRLWRWTRKTHLESRVGDIDIVWYLRRSSTLRSRKVWREGKEEQFVAGCLTLWRYQLARMRRPDYAMASAEPSA